MSYETVNDVLNSQPYGLNLTRDECWELYELERQREIEFELFMADCTEGEKMALKDAYFAHLQLEAEAERFFDENPASAGYLLSKDAAFDAMEHIQRQDAVNDEKEYLEAY